MQLTEEKKKVQDTKNPKQLPSDIPEFIQLVNGIKQEVIHRNNRNNPDSIVALHAASAIRFGRPLDRAMLVFFGESGVGKSATANRFFEKDIFKTNEEESETKEILELGVNVESDDVAGILSLVDMPGIFDTEKEDEAKNTALIKKFRSSNKSLAQREPPLKLWILANYFLGKTIYPNAILYLFNATDKRLKGNNSRLSRGLDQLKSTGLVDTKYPNLIIVATHASDLAKTKEKFIEKATKLKETVLSIVKEKFGANFSNTPFVLVENDPDGAVIPENSEFPILLDGSQTYGDLFHELCMLFIQNGDLIGNSLLRKVFQDLNKPEVFELSRLTLEDLNPSEINIAKKRLLEEPSYMKTEIAKLLDNNGVSNISYDHIKQKIYESGFTMINDIKGIPVSHIFDEDLEYGALYRLTNRLGMTDDLTVSYTFADKIGSFYDPVLEADLPGNILREMPLDKENRLEINGRMFFLPKGIKVQEIQDMSVSIVSAFNKESYEETRRKELGLAFKPYIAHNFKRRWIEQRRSSYLAFTFVMEKVINKVEIDSQYFGQNIDEYLMQDLEKLPNTYDIDTAEIFHEFFKIYGPYFIAGQYVGGSITGKRDVNIEHINPDSINSTLDYLTAYFGRMANIEAKNHIENSSMANILFQDSTTSLQYLGGNASKIPSKSLHDLTSTIFDEWYQSVDRSPIGLQRRYILKPVSELLSDHSDQSKKIALLNAINQYTKGEFASQPQYNAEPKTRQEYAMEAKKVNEESKVNYREFLVIFMATLVDFLNPKKFIMQKLSSKPQNDLS